jgi:hypothetical protein
MSRETGSSTQSVSFAGPDGSSISATFDERVAYKPSAGRGTDRITLSYEVTPPFGLPSFGGTADFKLAIKGGRDGDDVVEASGALAGDSFDFSGSYDRTDHVWTSQINLYAPGGVHKEITITIPLESLNGAQSANVALLGNYMASSFVTAAQGNGGTPVSEASSTAAFPSLATPHTA